MRILLADDQAKVRSAIRLMLEQDSEIAVLGEAVDATGLLDWVKVVCPDLVLLDWELPGREAEELVSTIRGDCSRVRIVAMSGHPEAQQAALAAGADGFVSKGDPPERLLEAIRTCTGSTREQEPRDAGAAEASRRRAEAGEASGPRAGQGREASR